MVANEKLQENKKLIKRDFENVACFIADTVDDNSATAFALS